MKNFENWLFKKAGLVIGLMNGIFIGFLIALFPVWWSATASAKWWEIASAVATSFAAFTGLFVWWHKTHVARSIEMLRARVAAAHLHAPFHGLAVKLSGGARNLREAPKLFVNGKERHIWLKELEYWRTKITDETVWAAMSLPNIGPSLLAAIVEVDMFLGALAAQARDEANALELLPRAQKIENLCRFVVRDCQKVIAQVVSESGRREQ